eukprot:g587.t1
MRSRDGLLMPGRRLAFAAGLFVSLVGLGAVIFASGFIGVGLPILRTSGSAQAASDVSVDDPSSEKQTTSAPPKFQRVVVLLVDALRPDMVRSDKMPMTTNILRAADEWAVASDPEVLSRRPSSTNRARTTSCTFVSTAKTPTVTMPRLKALMTGVNPRFVDVFRNFDAKVAISSDNILRRLHRERAYRLVLLGDDTWANLFPDVFDPELSDPTHSFFAQDTTEVDINVTRHVTEFFDPSMEHPKSRLWDGIVMHYLGLDHVGHIRGPRSKLMKSKQVEMDVVIDRVVRDVAAQDSVLGRQTLFLLLSDHGMTESGNHGGASDDEINSVLAVFPPRAILPYMETEQHSRRSAQDEERHLSANLYQSNREEIISAFGNAPIVDQLDVVPTLSVLLGTGVPVESQGVVLQPFLRALLSTEDLTKALFTNVDQLWKWASRGHGATRLTPDVLHALGNAHSRVISMNNQSGNGSHVDLALESYLKVFKEQCRGQIGDSLNSGDYWQELQMGVGLFLMIVGTLGLLAYSACLFMHTEMGQNPSERAVGASRTPAYAFDGLAFLIAGQVGFFALGNSHTIGTIDFAGAYTGTTEFSKVSTGSVAVLMVFTGPILLALMGASALTQPTDLDPSGMLTLTPLLACVAYRAFVLTVYSVIALGFRHHLFVWSVFAPKLIYEIGQFGVQVIVLGVGAGMVYTSKRSGKRKPL